MSTELENKVKSTFPEFEITEEMEGIPVVIFSFLSVWLRECIKNEDQLLIGRFVNFVNL